METFIRNAESLYDVVIYLPFHFHSLQGPNLGEYSLYVGNTGYRVVLIPCDEVGKCVQIKDIVFESKGIYTVKIMGVSKHYE